MSRWPCWSSSSGRQPSPTTRPPCRRPSPAWSTPWRSRVTVLGFYVAFNIILYSAYYSTQCEIIRIHVIGNYWCGI
uniref:Uncharacterized protein n=1 Tax=Setaria viridis TaxID=4556 RepID=A0A4U6VVC0_SETVI|nr:hypothetical protein SEVIR_3G352332v2 [Setaria viridis]